MSIPNIFSNSSLETGSLQAAVRNLPLVWGDIGRMAAFKEVGIDTTMPIIDFENGTSSLIQASGRGTDGRRNVRSVEGSRAVRVPRFRIEDRLQATDIQNKRVLGQEGTLQSVDYAVDNLLFGMVSKVDQTREYVRAQALCGKVVEPGGETIYDAFTDMGISQTVVNFALGNAVTKVQSVANTAKDAIDVALTGTQATGYIALCSSTFFNALITHASVEKAYELWANQAVGADPLRGDVRRGFTFGEITYYSYSAAADVIDASGQLVQRKFIEEGTATIFPYAPDIFEEYYAPCDHVELANTLGEPRYAWSDINKGKGWVDLYAETDMIALCKKPRTLIKATMA